MLFWLLAAAVTLIACAALYFAALGRGANANAGAGKETLLSHFRLQLKEIEADTEQGRLQPAEATAAKGELARELLRVGSETPDDGAPGIGSQRLVLLGSLAATVIVAFGTYAALGQPNLPAEPLAARTAEVQSPAVATPGGGQMSLDQAITMVEQRLQQAPDDVKGWTIIAPIYMQSGRYADAATAYRKIIALSGPTADSETDLGEALMMQNGGNPTGEPLNLFKSAAARDPSHVRSRFYIAGELTQAGDFQDAIKAWNDVIAMSKGGETWLASAQAGLKEATDGLNGKGPGPDVAQIRDMVEGLEKRLQSQGGTIDDWTRLVRSRLVLGETDKAQVAYDAARVAYPDPKVRQELDVLAADSGLSAR